MNLDDNTGNVIQDFSRKIIFHFLTKKEYAIRTEKGICHTYRKRKTGKRKTGKFWETSKLIWIKTYYYQIQKKYNPS